MITDAEFETWEGWKDSRYAPNHFFQTYEWLSVVKATWIDLKITIRMIDGQFALPVFSRRMGPLVLEGSPLRLHSTPYGGFLGGGPQEFKREYMTGDFNELTLQPCCTDDRAGWELKKTIIIDLRNGCDAIWSGMKSETRNQVRKAMKSNVKVDIRRDAEWVEPVYEIFTKTYERQKVKAPVGIELFRQIAEKLVPEHALVFTAVYDERIVAYAIICFDEKTAYYLDGGLDRRYRQVCPTNIIQWEVVQWAVARHLQSYDMCGANMESIANFKAGFGGEVVNFPTREYTPTILGAVAWTGYNMLRPAIKRFGGMLAGRSVARHTLKGAGGNDG